MSTQIELERKKIKQLQEADNALLAKYNESSNGECLDSIRELITRYKKLVENSRLIGEDIIRHFCERRIFFWFIRVRYVTGTFEYKLPSIKPKQSRASTTYLSDLITAVVPVGTYSLSEFRRAAISFQTNIQTRSIYRVSRFFEEDDLSASLIHHYYFWPPVSIARLSRSKRRFPSLINEISEMTEMAFETMVARPSYSRVPQVVESGVGIIESEIPFTAYRVLKKDFIQEDATIPNYEDVYLTSMYGFSTVERSEVNVFAEMSYECKSFVTFSSKAESLYYAAASPPLMHSSNIG